MNRCRHGWMSDLSFPFSSLLFSSLFHFFFFSIFSFSPLFSTLPSLHLSRLISSTLFSPPPPLLYHLAYSLPLSFLNLFFFKVHGRGDKMKAGMRAPQHSYRSADLQTRNPLYFITVSIFYHHLFFFVIPLSHIPSFSFSPFSFFSLYRHSISSHCVTVFIIFTFRFLNIWNRFRQSESGFLERLGIQVVAHFLMLLLSSHLLPIGLGVDSEPDPSERPLFQRTRIRSHTCHTGGPGKISQVR